MIKVFRRITTLNQELRQVQDNVGETLKDLTSRQIIDGKVIANVVLKPGEPKVISHTLGRDLVGYILIKQSGPGAVWDDQQQNPTPARTLVLLNDLSDPDASLTISLWVF